MRDAEKHTNVANNGATLDSLAPSPAITHLHEHLGKKLDDASYLLGFAYSIIEGLTGGLPASDATIAEFKRGYDGFFLPARAPNREGGQKNNDPGFTSAAPASGS